MTGFNQLTFILFELCKAILGYLYAKLEFWDLATNNGSCIMQTSATTLTMRIYINPKLDDTAGKIC